MRNRMGVSNTADRSTLRPLGHPNFWAQPLGTTAACSYASQLPAVRHYSFQQLGVITAQLLGITTVRHYNCWHHSCIQSALSCNYSPIWKPEDLTSPALLAVLRRRFISFAKTEMADGTADTSQTSALSLSLVLMLNGSID
jgi:hypothetical protein